MTNQSAGHNPSRSCERSLATFEERRFHRRAPRQEPARFVVTHIHRVGSHRHSIQPKTVYICSGPGWRCFMTKNYGFHVDRIGFKKTLRAISRMTVTIKILSIQTATKEDYHSTRSQAIMVLDDLVILRLTQTRSSELALKGSANYRF